MVMMMMRIIKKTGPDHVGVIGLHLGRVFDPLYVGAYIASGYTNGYSEDINGSVSYGIEAEYKLSEKVYIFAQRGKVEDAIGDEGDNEYEGRSWRLGASAQLTDKLHASLDYEYSKSDNALRTVKAIGATLGLLMSTFHTPLPTIFISLQALRSKRFEPTLKTAQTSTTFQLACACHLVALMESTICPLQALAIKQRVGWLR
jgi:hypothetical protein